MPVDALLIVLKLTDVIGKEGDKLVTVGVQYTQQPAPIGEVMTTSSKVLPHLPLSIVQRKVTELPTVKPVMVEVGELGEVIVAVPLTIVHVPVP